MRNRVTSIQELTPTASWRFVAGKQNPADCASRGIDANQLAQHSLWWVLPGYYYPHLHGPQDIAPEADLEARARFSLITTQNLKLLRWNLLDDTLR